MAFPRRIRRGGFYGGLSEYNRKEAVYHKLIRTQVIVWNYGDRNVLYIMITARIAYKNQELTGDCYEKARYDFLL